MNGKRAKWIKKVVISKHPKIMEMIMKRYGEERAKTMTYNQVIKACKKMWKDRAPGIEQWEIYKEVKEAK